MSGGSPSVSAATTRNNSVKIKEFKAGSTKKKVIGNKGEAVKK
jgi:hypothetical protein